jgi:hypothetical protein
MRVGVNQAGYHRTPPDIDHLAVVSRGIADIGNFAYRENPTVPDG